MAQQNFKFDMIRMVQLEELMKKNKLQNKTAFLESLIQKEWSRQFPKSSFSILQWGEFIDGLSFFLDFNKEKNNLLVLISSKYVRDVVRGIDLVIKGNSSIFKYKCEIFAEDLDKKDKDNELIFDEIIFDTKGQGYRFILSDSLSQDSYYMRTFSKEIAKDFFDNIKKLTRKSLNIPHRQRI